MAEIYNPEDGYRADGQYPVYKTHELKNPLELAIHEFEAVAMRFALDFINDAKQREIYKNRIIAVREQVLSDVKNGKMTLNDGAAYCNEMRNHIMRESRLASSPEGRAYAQKLKPDTGVPLEDILNKKSHEAYKKPYEMLTKLERDAVHYEIIRSSAKDRLSVTRGTARLRLMGNALIVVTGVLAVHAIMNAEDKRRETVIQASSIGGGVAGGAIAGLTVSVFCGPGAPVCAVVIVLIGSVVGGTLAGTIAENTYDDVFRQEAEEFSKWVK
jgi:hypothetical protein